MISFCKISFFIIIRVITILKFNFDSPIYTANLSVVEAVKQVFDAVDAHEDAEEEEKSEKLREVHRCKARVLDVAFEAGRRVDGAGTYPNVY